MVVADVPVIVAGAGPVGLMTAAELALQGVPVIVLEKRARQSSSPRALGLHARTLELLAQRGLADDALAGGGRTRYGHFAALPVPIDFSRLDTPYPFMLSLPQDRVEELLERRARALNASVLREHEITAATSSPTGVTVTVRAPGGELRLTGSYLVGCDGAQSTVRTQAGIGFPGVPEGAASLVADAVLDRSPPPRAFPKNDTQGLVLLMPTTGDLTRIVVIDEHSARVPSDRPVTLSDVRAALRRVCGDDFGIHSPRRVVRVGDASHQADRYRVGRILLAGDAAHAFFPAGGQGLNVGLSDAVNLGWKLAASLNGWAPVHLLDTYESERRAAADEVMASTRAQSALMTDFSSRAAALKTALGKLLSLPEANRAVARSIAGLSDTCPQPPGDLAGNGHPGTGHRIPDLPLSASQPQASRLYQLLSDARFVLLHLDGVTHAPPTAPRSRHVHTATAPPAALPEPLRGTTAALIRPDGHIAWVTDATTPSDVMEQARAAVRRWCEPTADGAVP